MLAFIMESVNVIWLFLASISLACACIVGSVLYFDRQSRLESDKVLKQGVGIASTVETSLLPHKEIESYELKRAELFDGQLTAKNIDMGEGDLPENTWQRHLDDGGKKQLKTCLLRRAIANMPRWVTITSEINSKYRLYKHGLLDDVVWEHWLNIQNELNEELTYLRLEAECLDADWGDKVLKDSMVLYRIGMAQREQKRLGDEMKQKQINKEEKEKNSADKQREQREKAAERAAEKLIKDEELEKERAAATARLHRKASNSKA